MELTENIKLEYEVIEGNAIIYTENRKILPEEIPIEESQRFFQACRHLNFIASKDYEDGLIPIKGIISLILQDRGFEYQYS